MKREGLRIIDVRGPKLLDSGIMKGAICIDFNGGFATWVGTLIDPQEEVVLYGEKNTVVEAIRRLLRIGYTNIRGYADFPIEEWQLKGQQAYKPEWAESLFDTGRSVVDVRKPQEWKNGIADTPDTIMLELSQLFTNVSVSINEGGTVR